MRVRARLCLIVLASLACRGPTDVGSSGDDPSPLEPIAAPSTEPEAPARSLDGEGEPFAELEPLAPRPWAAWPLENVDIVGFDGWRIDATHGNFVRDRGLVFRSEPGVFVLAIADATVAEVSRETTDDGALELSLDHGHGIVSHYAPLSDALVHAHLPVERGSAIALAAGTSLRLRVTIDGIDVDPLLILRQPLHRWPALLRAAAASAPAAP